MNVSSTDISFNVPEYIDADTFITIGNTDYRFRTCLDVETKECFDIEVESAFNPYGNFDIAEKVPGVATRAYAAIRPHVINKLREALAARSMK